VKYEGMFTDAAVTHPVGEIDEVTQRLLEVTERSLAAGIAAATVDNHVGDIGAAIQGWWSRPASAIVRELVGHGVGFAPHEEIQIPNYGKPKRGKKLVAGLTIAIEPMVNVGTAKTRTLADKWTVVTASMASGRRTSSTRSPSPTTVRASSRSCRTERGLGLALGRSRIDRGGIEQGASIGEQLRRA
jgi:methionine aminopeptidase